MASPAGYSLHIGINEVDPNHYQGWDGPLNACESDAQDMQAIAVSRGFQSQILLTRKATRERVLESIQGIAQRAKSGDLVWISFSGHGGWVWDLEEDESDEEDGRDETWCLYDGQLLDDELYQQWAAFAPGVRIAVVSDSCHSGTVVRVLVAAAPAATNVVSLANAALATERSRVRAMPDAAAIRTFRENRALYERIQAGARGSSAKAVPASVVLISGCQDNQYSYDGPDNGAFTAPLLQVWREGTFQGDYRRFHREIQQRLPDYQSPNYFTVGTANPKFESQVPFTI